MKPINILNKLNESLTINITDKIAKEFESYQPMVNAVCEKLFSKYESKDSYVEYSDISQYESKWGPYTCCSVKFGKYDSKNKIYASLDICSKEDDDLDEKEFNSGIRYIQLCTDRDIEERMSHTIGKVNKDDINETLLYKLCIDSEPYKEIVEDIQDYLGEPQKIEKDYGKGLDALKQRLEDSNLFYNIEIDNCDSDEFDYSVVVNTNSGDWSGHEEGEMISAIKDSGYKYMGSEEVDSGVWEAFFNE